MAELNLTYVQLALVFTLPNHKTHMG